MGLFSCKCPDCRPEQPKGSFFDDEYWEADGAISHPLVVLGGWLLGGRSGQDPHAERAPLL